MFYNSTIQYRSKPNVDKTLINPLQYLLADLLFQIHTRLQPKSFTYRDLITTWTDLGGS